MKRYAVGDRRAGSRNEAVEIPERSRNWGRTFLVYPAGRTTGRYLWKAACGYRSRRQAH